MDYDDVCKIRHKAIDREVSQLSSRMSSYSRNDEVILIKEALEIRIKNLENDIETLKSERTWMIRLVLGAVVVAVMSLVLISGPLDGVGM